MVPTVKEIKLTDTTSSYEVKLKLTPGKSFRDYLAAYNQHVDQLESKKPAGS